MADQKLQKKTTIFIIHYSLRIKEKKIQKMRSLIATTLIILLVHTSFLNAQICSSYYRVLLGDSCTSIAQAYVTTQANLQTLNPTLNCNSLPYNQLICVPTPSQISLACQTYYLTNAGDSCANIALAYNLNVAFLQILNPNLNCATTLTAGQFVCVAASNSAATTTTTTTTTTTAASTTACTNTYQLVVG